MERGQDRSFLGQKMKEPPRPRPLSLMLAWGPVKMASTTLVLGHGSVRRGTAQGHSSRAAVLELLTEARKGPCSLSPGAWLPGAQHLTALTSWYPSVLSAGQSLCSYVLVHAQ